MHYWGDILNHCVSDRDAIGADQQLIDIAFGDLLQDPMQIVRQIYERFELPLGHDVVIQMQDFLGKNKRHNHGVHNYTLDQFGLNESMIDQRFGDYIERFISA